MNNINIKELRESKGITQAELSRRSGIKAPNLHKYESGGTVPTTKTLNRILSALDMEITIKWKLKLSLRMEI